MGWAAISCRKMALKQRINQLEVRLMNISQELQTQYDSASYAQQALGVEKSQALMNLQNTYSSRTSSLSSAYQDSTDSSDLSEYSQKLQEEQLAYSYNQMIQNSLFSAKETAMQTAINEAESQLEAEQEQLETQLEAARAEYQSLDEACSQDIQDGAIKLA